MQAEMQQALDWISSQHENMCQQLRDWANINTFTYNTDGLDKFLGQLTEYVGVLSPDSMETVGLDPVMELDDDGHLNAVPVGKALVLRKRPNAPKQILFTGHYDTVFPANHPFQSVVESEPGIWNGPGVNDMKGGLLIMLHALQALEQSPYAEQIGWQIIFNPDEEIGSPCSSKLFKQQEGKYDFGLIFEPAITEQGDLVNIRKGSGKYAFVVKGQAAHAGRAFHEGRNAITAAAKLIADVDSLNNQRDGVTLNVGKIVGGGPINVVPDLASFHIDVRIKTEEDGSWIQENLQRIADTTFDAHQFEVTLHGEIGRGPKLMTEGLQRLIDAVSETAAQLGITIGWRPSGGVCDGNNLAALGLPVIDSLGARGGLIHSPREYIVLESLVERAQLTALLLMRYAEAEWQIKS